jgi:hypothetical protein
VSESDTTSCGLSNSVSSVGLEDAPSRDDDPMNYPLSTGQAAQLIRTTEPRLADLVRKGKIQPEPTIFAGRRLWERSHIRKAAECLGLFTAELRRQISQDVADVS